MVDNYIVNNEKYILSNEGNEKLLKNYGLLLTLLINIVKKMKI